MSSIFVQEASQLNNYGVTMLAYGDHYKAFAAFKSALEKLAVATSFDNNNHDSMTTPTPTVSRNNVASGLPTMDNGTCLISASPIGSQQSLDNTDSSVCCCRDDGPFFTYRQAFQFNPMVPLSPSFHVNASFYSAVVLFNLALTYHLGGTLYFLNESAQQGRALSLYDAALGYLKQVRREMEAETEIEASSLQKKESIHYVIIASLNNKAQIHYELSEFGKTRQHLNQMTAMIKSVNATGMTSHLPDALFDQQDMDGFLLNIIAQKNPPPARAA